MPGFEGFCNFPFAYDGQHLLFMAFSGTEGTIICDYANGSVQTLIAPGQAAPGGGVFEPSYGGSQFSVDGLAKVTPSGSASMFGTAIGQNVAFGQGGNLFSAATIAGDIYQTSPGGVSQIFRSMSSPIGLAFDQSGDLFVSDEDSATITEFTPSGNSQTYASFAGSVSPFPADASVDFYGLAFDTRGILYVAESDGTDGAIGIVTSGGTIQTYATFPGVPTFIADPSVSLVVPEPLSMPLLALGAIGTLSRRRRGR